MRRVPSVRPWQLFTTRELARALRLRPETLAAWRRCGAGPMWREVLGCTIYYRAADVDEWVRRQMRHRLVRGRLTG